MKRYLLPVIFAVSVSLVLLGLFQKASPTKNEVSQLTLEPTSTSVLLSSPTVVITPYTTYTPSTIPATSYGKRVKTSNCIASSGLQDKTCTPGDIFQGTTREQICASGYSKSVRNVPEGVKDEVYREYGITSRKTGEYEVDHLISLELGGSNDISNLWPEAAEPKPGFHEKDAVENYLHSQVCLGTISVQEAQFEISDNWLNVYNKIH